MGERSTEVVVVGAVVVVVSSVDVVGVEVGGVVVTAVVVVLDVFVEAGVVVVLDVGSSDSDVEHAPRTRTTTPIVIVSVVRLSGVPME